MKPHVRRIIERRILQHITPQPLAHGIAVAMYQKDSKSGCCNFVNPTIVFHLQIFKEQEHGNRTQQGHYLVRVTHKVISVPNTSVDASILEEVEQQKNTRHCRYQARCHE